MRIVWDEPKRLTNLKKHRLDFADLTETWVEVAVQTPARDRREKLTGRLGGMVVTAIVERLGREGLAVISMRPASVDERRLLE